MTQKEIWTGYWNRFTDILLNMFFPFSWLTKFFRTKSVDTRRDKVPGIPNYRQAPPPPPLSRQHQEIKDILDNMLKEIKN
jgi:hypothetical protein